MKREVHKRMAQHVVCFYTLEEEITPDTSTLAAIEFLLLFESFNCSRRPNVRET